MLPQAGKYKVEQLRVFRDLLRRNYSLLAEHSLRQQESY